jgi:hypothetical protein
MSEERKQLNLLEGLSRRLQNDPSYMAHVLSIFQMQEGLDDEDLANYFNSYPEFVLRLTLCKRPDSDSPDFAEQVRNLSDFTLIDEAALAHVIRQVDSLAALANNPSAAEEENSLGLFQLSGTLAAARDRDDVPPTPREEDIPDEGETK